MNRSAIHSAPSFRLLFLGVALLAGCSGGGGVQLGLEIQRVVLEPARGDGAGRQSQRVRELRAGADAGWTAAGCDGELIDYPGGNGRKIPRYTLSASADLRELRIPGEFDPREFQQVEVTLMAKGDMWMRAQARLAGVGQVGTPLRTRVAASRMPQTLLLDLRVRRRAKGPFDELVLMFDTGQALVAVESVTLLKRPLAAWLPDPSEGARMLRVGDEYRRGLALSSENALSGEFWSPGQGADLLVSYATPEELRLDDVTPKLSITLVGKNGKRVQKTRRMESVAKQVARWQSARIPLDGFGEQEVSVLFELEGYGEEGGLCALGEPAVVTRRAAPPTVLLVTSDTHRADHVGAAQTGVEVDTPALDALAQEGVFFERCYSVTNVTNPSHIAIMTAAHPRDFRITDNRNRLSEEAMTLAEAFQQSGFLTFASVSAPHLSPEVSGLGQGFDRVASPTRGVRRASDAAGQVREWLDDARDNPVFVWLHLFDAHTPYAPPGDFDRHYYPAGRDPFDESLPAPDVPIPEWIEGLRDVEFPARQYAAEVRYLDDVLRRTLLYEDRIRKGVVAITSDHGESLGEHGIYWDHGELYPVSLHVPLILRWPGGPRGERVAGEVENTDLGRTLLNLVGLESVDFPGRDLRRALEPGYASDEPRFALSAHGTSASLTQGKWHLMLSLETHHMEESATVPAFERHAIELYDLEDDPHCEVDLSATQPDAARRLRALLVSWLGSARALDWASGATSNPDFDAQLSELGYTEGEEPLQMGAWIDPACECTHCSSFR